jgi:hypothetical protein
LNTNDNLRRVVSSCLASWIDGQKIPPLHELIDENIPFLKEAYEEQEQLGWEHMVRGRWSIKWGEAYNCSKTDTEGNSVRTTAEKWGKDLIVLTWQLIWDIWTLRNEDVHGTTAPESNKIAKNKLIDKLVWLHKQNDEYSKEIGKTITRNEIENIPMENLLMMEIQMK